MGTPAGVSLYASVGACDTAFFWSDPAGTTIGNEAEPSRACEPKRKDETLSDRDEIQTLTLTGARQSSFAVQNQQKQANLEYVELQGKLKNLEARMSILREENSNLSRKKAALGNLNGYQEQLLELLGKAHASISLKNELAVQNKNGMAENAECFMGQMFCDGQVPEDQWFRRYYIPLSKDDLLQLENAFIIFLDRTIGTWKADVASRSKTEALLATALSARRRVGIMMLEIRPDVHQAIIGNTQPASPASSSCVPFNRPLDFLLETLNISESQRQAMSPVWISYLEQMKVLKEQASESQLLLGLFSAYNGTEGPSTVEKSQDYWAKNLLDRAAAVEFLAQCPQRVMATYGLLAIGIASELTAMQNAKLLLVCRPFVPDYIQLCASVLGIPEGQELP